MNFSSSSDASVYYTFALKWSPDYVDYNIHGLWPEFSISKPNVDEFDFGLLNSDRNLLQKLELVWNSDLHAKKINPEVTLEADIKFWTHEWDKHGRHSPFDQNGYFKRAVQIYDKLKPELPVSDLHHQLHFSLDKNLEVIGDHRVFYPQ